MAVIYSFEDLTVTMKEILYSFSSDFVMDEGNVLASELRTDISVPYPGSTGCIDRGSSSVVTWQGAKFWGVSVGPTKPDFHAFDIPNRFKTPYSTAKIFMENYAREVRKAGITYPALPIHPVLLSRGLEFELEYQRKRLWIAVKRFGVFKDDDGDFQEIEIRLESHWPKKPGESVVIRERLRDKALMDTLEDDVRWAFWSSLKLLKELEVPVKDELFDEVLHEELCDD